MKKKERIFLGTVVHPQSLKFWDDFLQSVRDQEDQDFELLVLTDQVTLPLVSMNQPLHVIATQGSPVSLRKQLLKEALQLGTEYLVLLDSDDLMSSDRIGNSREAFDRGEKIIFHDLWKFTKNPTEARPWLSSVLTKKKIVAEDLLNSNCLGFSNTGFSLSAMPSSVFDISEEVIAFDWAFFSRFLRVVPEAHFHPESRVYYRQYESNMSQFQGSPDEIDRLLRVKIAHYGDLIGLLPEASGLQKQYQGLLRDLPKETGDWVQFLRQRGWSLKSDGLWWENLTAGGLK